MKLEDVTFHFSLEPAMERKLDEILLALAELKRGQTTMVDVIADFAAKQTAWNAEISADLTAIAANLNTLNTTITTLQNTPGAITAQDQALLNDLQVQGTNLQAQAMTVAGKAPPAPPVGP